MPLLNRRRAKKTLKLHDKNTIKNEQITTQVEAFAYTSIDIYILSTVSTCLPSTNYFHANG